MIAHFIFVSQLIEFIINRDIIKQNKIIDKYLVGTTKKILFKQKKMYLLYAIWIWNILALFEFYVNYKQPDRHTLPSCVMLYSNIEILAEYFAIFFCIFWCFFLTKKQKNEYGAREILLLRTISIWKNNQKIAIIK